ncbi:glycerate kinase [Yokenella regensburgei]|jgi:glycerate kinase|uniref:Glycerate kinase n=1 Tax=Yokenella regensburgei TaxID=158877 RepID=A0AB38FWV1_9ENTR|nr:glycerate kinase [Yokenella regensburgei]EHM44536.1 glycerate kinase [Yokenella regensburgei ATCC 43003]KFD23604.1 glycerate kinase [Yokenella regensburgei ATCC 49455]SQA63739.1 Glycerate kinase [Yokenella regensburgei]SQA65849.1 Glycerate kinase [Yokenella regensburgei]SUQ04468.1 Glycerate kinase [Yokenella regensburgei]
MKIVIAPDSFKESLSALEVAQAIEAGCREIWPDAEYVNVPMADGGEGTVESMVAASQGHFRHTPVTGPLGETVSARWGMMGDGKTAVIEMAAASGLHYVAPELRNPMKTTSFGTGELIRAALDEGVEHIILGIGGSATNDGGAGMMQALGARLLSAGGSEIAHRGEALESLVAIDLSACHPRLQHVTLTVACDVNNPLCGPQGASAVFGPQKGATTEMVARLDIALANWGTIIHRTTGRTVLNAPGAGAAGGMGAALMGLLNATLCAGVEIVIDRLGLEAQVKDADLVITGEGRLDSQSICGKTPIGVARVAKRYHKPVIALAGGLREDHGVVHQHGIDAAFSILTQVVTLPEALAEARTNLQVTARNVAAVWEMGRQSVVR